MGFNDRIKRLAQESLANTSKRELPQEYKEALAEEYHMGYTYLGQFETEGKLYINDPCYGTSHFNILEGVNPGYWYALVKYVNAGKWGTRVASLVAIKADR